MGTRMGMPTVQQLPHPSAPTAANSASPTTVLRTWGPDLCHRPPLCQRRVGMQPPGQPSAHLTVPAGTTRTGSAPNQQGTHHGTHCMVSTRPTQCPSPTTNQQLVLCATSFSRGRAAHRRSFSPMGTTSTSTTRMEDSRGPPPHSPASPLAAAVRQLGHNPSCNCDLRVHGANNRSDHAPQPPRSRSKPACRNLNTPCVGHQPSLTAFRVHPGYRPGSFATNIFGQQHGIRRGYRR